MTESQPVSPRLILALVMGGVVVWGVYLAVGAYRANFNPWAGAIVIGAFALFLGWWLLLLRARGRRKS